MKTVSEIVWCKRSRRFLCGWKACSVQKQEVVVAHCMGKVTKAKACIVVSGHRRFVESKGNSLCSRESLLRVVRVFSKQLCSKELATENEKVVQ